MSSHHLVFLLTSITIALVEGRGRYEYIEEADLPAFYSMRSAQMAQKAQLAPQLAAAAAVPQDPYQQYLQYQMYQQMEVPQPAVYAPFAVYSPVYRAQAAGAPPPFQAARPAPVQYHPMAYYHAQGGQASPIRKKSAMT
ncbi:hypothetical protein CAEBREN_17095 [Caenorhabditis brenneri]|uniref:Uncharacterized protein n=1 Tax=Caenorhabditis brenneri TaxID=135651 RepID=G0NE93_CAEBE|nr:hypothetical protein CAEBREN_17095 [Caenorhabditis brenneri]